MTAVVEGYDVIVVGLGSMGSAAAHALAARGLRVLGLETFGLAHDQGSAHGGTRIVRQAYFRGPGVRGPAAGCIRRLAAAAGAVGTRRHAYDLGMFDPYRAGFLGEP